MTAHTQDPCLRYLASSYLLLSAQELHGIHVKDSSPPASDNSHLQQALSGSQDLLTQPTSETMPRAVLIVPPSPKPGADFGESTLEFFSLAYVHHTAHWVSHRQFLSSISYTLTKINTEGQFPSLQNCCEISLRDLMNLGIKYTQGWTDSSNIFWSIKIYFFFSLVQIHRRCPWIWSLLPIPYRTAQSWVAV